MNPIPFTNQYVTLGDKFYVKTRPVPVAAPALIKFNKVLAALGPVLQRPFIQQEGKDRYMQPPEPDEVVRQTFCGT